MLNSPLNLIFIISQPRSGSTLLQSILSNNGYVTTSSEPWLLLPFLTANSDTLNRSQYNSYLASIGINDFIKKTGGEKLFNEKLNFFLNSIYSELNPDGKYKYVLDKTPRYYEILPRIKEVFPSAKIIILKRNPFAVLNSIIDTWNIEPYIGLDDYKRDILNGPFLIQKFLDQNKENVNIKEVFYESIIMDPENSIKQIYEWLSLPFKATMLDYSSNEKTRGHLGDKKAFTKLHVPLNDNIEQWKIKISKTNKWKPFFEGYSEYLGKEFLKNYGNYEPLNKSNSSIFEYFEYIFKNDLIEKFSKDSKKAYIKYLLYKHLKIKLF